MRVSRHRMIAAATDQVWRVIDSVDRIPEWSSGVESATHLAGPERGLGRKQRLNRILYSHELEVEQEVVVWEPGRILALGHLRESVDGRETSGVKNFVTTISMTAEGVGSRVGLEYRWDTGFGIAWVQSKLMAGRVMGKEIIQTLKNIERLATERDP